MGRQIYIGQGDGASITISPDGKTLSWSVPDSLPDPVRLWVSEDGAPRKPQAEGRGTIDNLPWVVEGHTYRWEVTAGATDQLQAAIIADTRKGFPLSVQVLAVGGGAAAGSPPPGGAAAAGLMDWLQGTTSTGPGGPQIPNIAIAAAVLLGGAMLLKKR